MKVKKILIVDDSAFMRRVIKDIIEEDNELEVIGIARNGEDALKKIDELDPDVITLDVEMPIMDGIETLAKIGEKTKKIPVIMLSSLTVEGAEMTIKALELGAVDFISKPESIFNIESDDKKKEIINKLKMAANVKNLNYKSSSSIKLNKISSDKKIKRKQLNGKYNTLISVGTSTGGPRALQSLLTKIPENIDASILVVQHMPVGFTKSLSDRLDSMCEIKVKEAENLDVLEKGVCYIAPGDRHIRLEEKADKITIHLDDGQRVSGHKPSVDVLMDETAQIKTKKIVAAILTGMGADGAKGIKKVKEMGGYTIAQNEETCVVYGMPKSAVAIDAIHKVLPIDDIAAELTKKAGV